MVNYELLEQATSDLETVDVTTTVAEVGQSPAESTPQTGTFEWGPESIAVVASVAITGIAIIIMGSSNNHKRNRY